jgi:hypothetical protein
MRPVSIVHLLLYSTLQYNLCCRLGAALLGMPHV